MSAEEILWMFVSVSIIMIGVRQVLLLVRETAQLLSGWTTCIEPETPPTSSTEPTEMVMTSGVMHCRVDNLNIIQRLTNIVRNVFRSVVWPRQCWDTSTGGRQTGFLFSVQLSSRLLHMYNRLVNKQLVNRFLQFLRSRSTRRSPWTLSQPTRRSLWTLSQLRDLTVTRSTR